MEEVNAERSTFNVQLRSTRLGLPVFEKEAFGANDLVTVADAQGKSASTVPSASAENHVSQTGCAG